MAVSTAGFACDGGELKGFGVVDPMPPPTTVSCSPPEYTINATVATNGDGNWELKLSDPTGEYRFNGSVAAESGEILSATPESDGSLSIVLKPEDAVVDAFADCASGSTAMIRVSVYADGGTPFATILSSDTGS